MPIDTEISSEEQSTEVEISKIPVIFAVLGLVLWLIPLIGLPIAIVGLILTVKRRASQPDKYTVSFVLLILALCLSVVNAGIGAYMGATGQHAMVNKLQGK